jgi:recombination protein RecA
MAKKEDAAAKSKANKDEPIPMPSAADRNAKIDFVIAETAKEHGEGCVVRAEHTFASYTLRRPTGIISIDIAMAGGWPAAAPNVLVGPDGVGKDYLLWRTMAETQRLYGKDFCAACYFTEFKPDKLYMKDYCGLQIAFSEDELADLDLARRSAGGEPLSAADLDHYRRQIGTFIPIYGLSADHGFDKVFDFVDTNYFQIVAVNSIGSLQTEAKEKTESFEEFAQQRNEAMLLSKVMPKFSMYLNRRDEFGRPNESTLILVNQVRSKDAAPKNSFMKGRVPQDKDNYKTASNAHALKHHKAIELFMHNGARIYEEGTTPAFMLGRKKTWELTKGKLGTHEGIKGEFNYFFGEGADVYGDLLNTAVALGVIDQSGSWFSYAEEAEYNFRVNSTAKAQEHLRKSPELVDYIRTQCFRVAGTVCRHH